MSCPDSFDRVVDMLEALRPSTPILCIRPSAIRHQVERIVDGFPGRVLFAAKSNPDPLVLRAIYEAGIRDFDTASIAEIELVAGLFEEAESFFHHPVKARDAIRSAYFDHGVRHFTIDHENELRKIEQVLDHREGIKIHVRFDPGETSDAHSFASKFGADPMEAAMLLGLVEQAGFEPGLAFHVGSQCLAPRVFEDALAMAGEILEISGVALRWLNCGGGFPVRYSGVEAPPLEAFLDAIRRGTRELPLPADCELLCEPGRVVVGDALSLIVQVHLRKDDQLYINEGIYGTLKPTCCASPIASAVPRTKLHRPSAEPCHEEKDFTIFGPTCDSDDVLPQPFRLAADVQEGDWIEISQVGAYSNAVASRFNGFGAPMPVVIRQAHESALIGVSP